MGTKQVMSHRRLCMKILFHLTFTHFYGYASAGFTHFFEFIKNQKWEYNLRLIIKLFHICRFTNSKLFIISIASAMMFVLFLIKSIIIFIVITICIEIPATLQHISDLSMSFLILLSLSIFICSTKRNA